MKEKLKLLNLANEFIIIINEENGHYNIYDRESNFYAITDGEYFVEYYIGNSSDDDVYLPLERLEKLKNFVNFLTSN